MLAVVQDVRIIVLAVPHGVVVALGATAVQGYKQRKYSGFFEILLKIYRQTIGNLV